MTRRQKMWRPLLVLELEAHNYPAAAALCELLSDFPGAIDMHEQVSSTSLPHVQQSTAVAM